MTIKSYLVLSFILLNAVGHSQKSPITHEAMWSLKRVGVPQISPDGSQVIFSVLEPSYIENDQISDIWIAFTNGSKQPRRLTWGKSSESGYQWSPDGSFIAFSAKRDNDEANQIYIMSMQDGGEAHRMTSLSTGASNPQWSPDGKSILFTSNVYPTSFADSTSKRIAEEKKKIKYKARVYTSFPVRDFDHWIDEKVPHLFVQSVTEGSVAKDLFTNVPMVMSAGFKLGSATWSPDSREIIFSASEDFNTSAFQEPTSNLYHLNVNGGNATKITNDGFDYGSPQFSKDGNYLYALSNANNNYKVYNLSKLLRYEWPSLANRTYLATTMDRPISSFTTSSDGTVYMTVEDQGNFKLYSITKNSIVAKPLIDNSIGGYSSVSVSGGTTPVIVANYESSIMPPEVARINPVIKSHEYISSFNHEKISTLDLPLPEVVWTLTSRGKKIRSLLVRPAGFDTSKKYPLFVVMHGGPAGAWTDTWNYRWNYHLLAAPGYVLVMTDYTGSTGYGDKFAQDIQFDPFKGPANEINEAAADVIKRYSFIDGNKQACGGGSYGGHLANWMQATTSHYKCIVCHAGLVNSEAQYGTSDVLWGREVMNGGAPWTQNETWKTQNPIRLASRFKTPILITVGEMDYRVPINNSLENWAALQRLKVPSRLVVFPEENHWILRAEDSRYWYSEVQNWLNNYLK